MQRLASERFCATSFHCTYYRDLELCGHLGFITGLGEQSRAVLTPMRRQGQAAFTGQEKQLLRSAAPVVDQVVRAVWEPFGEGRRNRGAGISLR